MTTVKDNRLEAIRTTLKLLGQERERARDQEARALEAIALRLREGQDAGLQIKEMAELAGITRQTAYNLLDADARS